MSGVNIFTNCFCKNRTIPLYFLICSPVRYYIQIQWINRIRWLVRSNRHDHLRQQVVSNTSSAASPIQEASLTLQWLMQKDDML